LRLGVWLPSVGRIYQFSESNALSKILAGWVYGQNLYREAEDAWLPNLAAKLPSSFEWFLVLFEEDLGGRWVRVQVRPHTSLPTPSRGTDIFFAIRSNKTEWKSEYKTIRFVKKTL
jgi:hypothetical protein